METGSTLHLVLMIILTPISVGAMLLVVRWFVTQQSETEQADRVDQIWAQRDAWGEATCRQLINREVSAGLTPNMVRLAWGSPDSVQSPSAAEERWLYQSDAAAGSVITFQKGQVVRFSHSTPPDARSGLDPWLVIALLIGLALMLAAVTLIVIFVVG